MSDVIQDGINWMMAQLVSVASQDVTYARGYDQVDVKAVIGRTKLKTTDGSGGQKVEWTDKDFIIRVADLKFLDEPITPQRGDLVHWARNGTLYTYEVRPYSFEPPYRDDAHQLVYRIHAKLIETDTAYG